MPETPTETPNADRVIWTLESTDERHPRTLRVIDGTARTVGRGVRADFVIDDTLLSRVHCRLTAAERELRVEDLDSTNGVFVNGSRIRRARLSDGDLIRAGGLTLRVRRGLGSIGDGPPRRH